LRKKGLPTLLRALRHLHQPLSVAVVGNASGKAALQAELQQLKPGQECRFLGVQTDMPRVYAALDCLAHPTTQDVFPMVLLEAMAHYVPVITTAAPYNSMADLLTADLHAAVIADPQAEQACAQALQRLATDTDYHERLAVGGRAFAQRYDWDSVKQRYYEIYRSLQ
jgi:glycosyltransferase involved in cell wall biosynthesis